MSECRFERDVLRAADENTWTDALRSHVRECADCNAAVDVAPWMATLAAEEVREHRLPDPQVVWLKAQLLRNTIMVDRASRPMRAAQLISYVVVAAGWSALMMSNWTSIERWLHSFTPASVFRNAAAGASLSMSFFVLVFVLASATIGLALHTIVAEE
jgi:hypothetical protein